MVMTKEIQDSPPFKTKETKSPLFNQAVSRFQDLINSARELDIKEPNAATLSTADANGCPSARVGIGEIFVW